MTDVYKTPSANLVDKVELEGYGSLERGIAGQYQFSIREIIGEGWQKTKGAKGTVWLAMLLYCIVAIPVSIGIPFVLSLLGLSTEPVPGEPVSGAVLGGIVVSQLLVIFVIMPMYAGLFMIGLKIAAGAPASATDVVGYFHKIITIFITIIVMYIMLAIGFILFVIPGIYLLFAYYLAVPLVVEKDLGPWQALEASRKAVSKRWFRFVGLNIALIVIMMVSAIPLGIGLIWTLPLAFIAYGIAYRNIFGFRGAVAA